MNKKMIGAALLAALTAATSAQAELLQDHGGLYFGIGAGASILKPELINDLYELDDGVTPGFRVHGGYRFHKYFAGEVFYSDMGKAKIKPLQKGDTIEVPYKMAGAELIYLPFGTDELQGFDPLLVLGMGSLMADKDNCKSGSVCSEQEKNFQVIGGLGLQYTFNHHFSARLLGEVYDKDANMVSLGVSYSPHTAKDKAPEPVIITEPAPVVVVEPPKPEPVLDSDGDGVIDAYDCCPNTAGGLRVNRFGCPVLDQSLQNINFAFRSYELTDYAKAVLDGVVESLVLYSTAKIELGAHTDSIGSLSYNQNLSQKRAESTRRYLISRGIAANRLTARGYGETMPIASNKTEDGRFQNRRVEIKITDRGEGEQGCGKDVQPAAK